MLFWGRELHFGDLDILESSNLSADFDATLCGCALVFVYLQLLPGSNGKGHAVDVDLVPDAALGSF